MVDVKCDVIVLTWNQRDVVTSFVDSFLKNTATCCRLIIIDNGSNDGTKEYLQSLRDTPSCIFKIILNDNNNGFVGGMNQGLQIAQAPYVCLANNDLIFTKGWMEEVISVFENNKNIGLLNPNSNNLAALSMNGESIEAFAERLKGQKRGVFIEMPFCIGFCMFIRREIVQKIGGLSKEFYPIFFEDTDYSLRVSREGFLIGVAAGAYVWHKEHASFKQMGKKQDVFFNQSRRVFIKKWGKTLRIAWIEDNEQDLLNDLARAIAAAKQANYITFYTKGFNAKREDIFKAKNVFEHSGVQFKRFNNYLGLICGIAVKKKRFDLIITNNKALAFTMPKIGQKVSGSYDELLVSKIKWR